MTVTWRTSVDVTEGYALVREDGKTDLVKYEAETGYFKSDIDESNMFWGLSPQISQSVNLQTLSRLQPAQFY